MFQRQELKVILAMSILVAVNLSFGTVIHTSDSNSTMSSFSNDTLKSLETILQKSAKQGMQNKFIGRFQRKSGE